MQQYVKYSRIFNKLFCSMCFLSLQMEYGSIRVILTKWNPETYLDTSQTTKMDFFVKIINGCKPLNYFRKKIHFTCLERFEYACKFLYRSDHLQVFYGVSVKIGSPKFTEKHNSICLWNYLLRCQARKM